MRHGYALRMNLGDPAFANGTADAVRAMQSRELAETVSGNGLSGNSLRGNGMRAMQSRELAEAVRSLVPHRRRD